MTLASSARKARDVETIRRRYIAAYEAANGRTPDVVYVKGWFRVRTANGQLWNSYRASEIANFTRTLESRAK